jgi:hypothetical protein
VASLTKGILSLGKLLLHAIPGATNESQLCPRLRQLDMQGVVRAPQEVKLRQSLAVVTAH